MKREQSLWCRLERQLSLPPGTVTRIPRIELWGTERLVVEGACHVKQCAETGLCLATGVGPLWVRGTDLCVVSLNENGLELTGRLTGLAFAEAEEGSPCGNG